MPKTFTPTQTFALCKKTHKKGRQDTEKAIIAALLAQPGHMFTLTQVIAIVTTAKTKMEEKSKGTGC